MNKENKYINKHNAIYPKRVDPLDSLWIELTIYGPDMGRQTVSGVDSTAVLVAVVRVEVDEPQRLSDVNADRGGQATLIAGR